MYLFILTTFILFATPGPGVLSLAGIGASFGFKPAIRFLLGLFLGFHIVILAVLSGVASLILTVPSLRFALLLLSSSYLLYLAFQIAASGSRVSLIVPQYEPRIISGIYLQLLNPKAYAVNTALLTGFSLYPENFDLEVLIKILTMDLLWIPLHFVWLYFGKSLNELNLQPNIQRRVNCFMAGSLLIVLLLSVTSISRS